MRHGLSLLLRGLLVEAAAINRDTNDCARFQIVCPACREAVHKRVRRRDDGTETHHLAHYREVPAVDVERCELRVASISARQVEEARVIARGQALAIFIARFRECVLRAVPDGLDMPLARMAARPRWRAFARDLQAHMRSAAISPEADTVWHELIGVFDDEPSLVYRPEAVAFARGMLSHALAPGSARQFVDLLSGAAVLLRRGVVAPPRPIPWPSGLRAAVRGTFDAIVHGSDLAFGRAMRQAGRTRDPLLEVEPGAANVMERAAQMLIRECHVVLFHVPYEAILREAVALAGTAKSPRQAERAAAFPDGG